MLADSIATASDLTRFYGTRAEKVHVVYPGVDVPPTGDLTAARRKFRLPERYFVFVGTLQPRKNIERLAQAFGKIRVEFTDVGLVLAGAEGWLYDPKWFEGIDGIQVTGYVSDEEKGALLSGAIALTFPSLYEGFGQDDVCNGVPAESHRLPAIPQCRLDRGRTIAFGARDAERSRRANSFGKISRTVRREG